MGHVVDHGAGVMTMNGAVVEGKAVTSPVTPTISSATTGPAFALLSPLRTVSQEACGYMRKGCSSCGSVGQEQLRGNEKGRWNHDTSARRPGMGRILMVDEAHGRQSYHIMCEYCSNLHDGTYGSGRFCSVHCARRVAASRKWEKQRDAKRRKIESKPPLQEAALDTSSPAQGFLEEGLKLSRPAPQLYHEGPEQNATVQKKFTLSRSSDLEFSSEEARTDYIAKALLTLSSSSRTLIADA